jgi:uncharacterized membrane protein
MTNPHVITASNASQAIPEVGKIGTIDIKCALIRGMDDFSEFPTHIIFLGIIYPSSAWYSHGSQ